ncbi:ABC transporter ATP-binding protein [Candidatus Binatia bacterium]|jgi:ABC-2 type transport system ATP-binding protein|nr:ABC transporter ATP-binding protein [Candidatus Binatia bacterium]
MSDGEPIIHAEGITKRFGDFVAVDDVSLRVGRGSIFAFLGANGSGKSTTIRMLIGLLTPSAGAIVVDGIDVIRHPRRVRDHIGYMGQKVSLYQGLSLRENVEFYAGLYGLGAAQLDERWGALRERFALGEAERDKPEDLPAGVRQRAGLALSTLHRPRVLFLDEPTAGVDVHNRALFWELIQDEADAGVTVFVTTHFLEEADYCDWISFIDAGRLVADASPSELRRRFSPGYRVTIAAGSSERAAQAEASLRGSGVAVARTSADELEVRAPELDAALQSRLGDLARLVPGLRVSVHQPEMTDVFRELMRAAAERAPKAAA